MFRSCLIASILVTITATSVNRCEDQPFPLEVKIRGCDQPRCNLVKETATRFQIDFNTEFEIKNLTTNLVTELYGLKVPYPLPDEENNACSNLMYGSCPLKKGEAVRYLFDFVIGKYYPEIALNIEISLTDENENVITCFNSDFQVIKAEDLLV